MSDTALKDARQEWLKLRSTAVGASEVAAVLGEDPRRDALALYAEKVGALEREETPFMRWGLRCEALTAEAYAEESGRTVVDPGARFRRHPDMPCLGATLDRLTGASPANPAPIEPAGGRPFWAPLECKVVGGFKADEWREDPPLEFVIQVQMQMACTGAQWASLAALIGWPPRPVWVDILRNDRFIAAALPRIEEFWLRVQRRDPPDPEPKPATREAVRALWAKDNGLTITLPEGTLDLVTRWQAAKAQLNASKKEADDLDVHLRARMREAAVGMLPDGTSLTLSTTNRAGYEVEPTTYRTLRRFTPKGLRRKS